jgi:hypothetical protein
MPLTQTELEVIEKSFGTGADAGSDAPNGYTVQGGLNEVVQIGQDMNEYGLDLSGLPAEKQEALRQATEDLEYYRTTLATLFGDDLEDELDGVELPDGTVITLPAP